MKQRVLYLFSCFILIQGTLGFGSGMGFRARLYYKQVSITDMGNECCPNSMKPTEFQTTPIQSRRLQTPSHLALPSKRDQEIRSQASMSPSLAAAPEQGTILLPDGSKYTGYLKSGIPNGQGMETHQSGDQYTGNFVDGLKQGQGTYSFENGSVYRGEFRKGQMDGQGRIQWPNGDYYEGAFKNNIINGYGKYYSKHNNSYYEGTYLDGKRHGKGTLRSDNQMLEGYWEHGEFRFRKVIPFQG